MDDLLGLDWNNKNVSQPQPQPQTLPQSQSQFQSQFQSQPFGAFPTLKPSQTPSTSGRSTPNILRPNPTTNNQPSLKIGSKPSTPANDSFASLLGPSSTKSNALSLQERQRQLLEEKSKADAAWNGYGPSSTTWKSQHASIAPSSGTPEIEHTDDILSAFNASAPVNRSTRFPPPQSGTSTPSQTSGMGLSNEEDDDDPFGLRSMPNQSSAPLRPAKSAVNDDDGNDSDDDILGMLGRPVEESRKPTTPSRKIQTQPERYSEFEFEQDTEKQAARPEDKAVAELVDMGFPANQAAIALARTESGRNVQEAVGILLREAHEEAKRKAPKNNGEKSQAVDEVPNRARPETQRGRGGDNLSSWMKGSNEISSSTSRSREQSGSKDKDVSQLASEIGTSLFKSANSLWKTSQKKVQQAVADFQQDSTSKPSHQPKWMRDAHASEDGRPSNVTDEAMMLESRDDVLPQRPNKANSRNEVRNASPLPQLERRASPALYTASNSRPASRLTRQDLESNQQEAYISPARRRKAQAPPLEENLIGGDSFSVPVLPSRQKSPLSAPSMQTSTAPKPLTTRLNPKPPAPRAQKQPPRKIPPCSSSALSSSSQARNDGSAAFKLGDYALALKHYNAALSPLPSTHPVAIVALTNRSLTNLKVGDASAALADAKMAIEVIGPGKGIGEELEGKSMREFWGKAIMRQAEALENLEKWEDAGKSWREAVDSNIGGITSRRGRERCEKHVKQEKGGDDGIPKKLQAVSRRTKPAVPKPNVLPQRPIGDSEATKRLKAANKAAEKAEDEKYALIDSVDARLNDWKGTKSDNLRALLGSLDKVLWEGSGWKTVGMQDLIQTNRVKIIYMKAISKVHPDKISRDATTEQKMISASVFSTLNEAWDKFKIDNKL